MNGNYIVNGWEDAVVAYLNLSFFYSPVELAS